MTIPHTILQSSANDEEEEETAPPRGSSSLQDSTATLFGTERHTHVAVKKSIGSFPRSVGPAADIRELEYISSLHQNAEAFLRSDGTISSKDIGPYLTSRYGMQISNEQAVDICLNLCGGKLRGELSAEKDALDEQLEAHQRDFTEDNAIPDHQEDDDKPEDDPVYYFDLVQVMSLLLIPELVQLQDRHDNLNGPDENVAKGNHNHHSSINSSNNRLKLGTEKGGMLDVVIRSMTDLFDQKLQKDILAGRVALDADLLATLLEGFGDVDAANDKVLLLQVLNQLGGAGTPFTAETFLKALTADVKSFPTKKEKEEQAKEQQQSLEEEPPTQTSMFYDVFGWNWEYADNHANTKELGHAPKPTRTAPFIDYAADTYGSVVLYTSIWSLFLLTTLIYLNFFLTVVRTETGGLICPPDQSFGCAIGNKIFGWILTAIFCGFYGIFFIVPTSIGNGPGKGKLLYLGLLITAVYTYAPFSTLIWYEKGVPHNTHTIHDYRTICPGFLGNNATEINERKKELEESPDGDKLYLRIDDGCMPAVEWCEDHPETLGKYIDSTPWYYTYDEFEICYATFQNWVKGALSTETGGPCDPFNNTCPNSGACGLRNLSGVQEPLFLEDYVCCHSKVAIPFESTRYQVANYTDIYDQLANTVCSDQQLGAPCTSTAMCELGLYCEDNVCALPPQVNDSGLLGSTCERNHDDCSSGFCLNGTCHEHPEICPSDGMEFFAGFRLDPFCRTYDEWCEYTDVPALVSSFSQNAGFEFDPFEDFCAQVLGILWLSGLIQFVNETDAEIANSYIEADHGHIEKVLLQPWARFVLFGIATVGFFALVAIWRKASAPSGKDRPRDYKIKCAAAHKVSNVIENALALHQRGSRAKGRLMRNFFLRGEARVETGGLFPTMKNVMSGHLSMKEGIRYPGRIWVGQVIQLVVIIMGAAGAVAAVPILGNKLDEYRAEIGRSLTQEEVDQMSNFEWITVTLDDLYVTYEEQQLLDTLPERWMFDDAAWPAVFAGIVAAVFCLLVYLPSTTNTIMKLRSGQLPSLHDPYFGSYRKTADNVVQNIANMVFGLAGGTAMIGAVFFVLVFAFTWNISRDYAIDYLAIAIGIGCTMVIKNITQKLLRARHFRSFYRKKPWDANFTNLFFECWYIASGVLVVVSRLIMFLLSSALWLGRIDVEFLHENVKIVGVGLDKVPVSFKRDILVHEAHTHPFIERLGAMYLLRLRDGEGFGSVAGTTWRSLFVCGLMPWIVKHRVNNNEEATMDMSYTPMAETSRRRSMVDRSRRHSILRASLASRRASRLPSEEMFESSRRESLLQMKQEDSFRSTISI